MRDCQLSWWNQFAFSGLISFKGSPVKSKLFTTVFRSDFCLLVLPFSLRALLYTLNSMFQSSWTSCSSLSHHALYHPEAFHPVFFIWHISGPQCPVLSSFGLSHFSFLIVMILVEMPVSSTTFPHLRPSFHLSSLHPCFIPWRLTLFSFLFLPLDWNPLEGNNCVLLGIWGWTPRTQYIFFDSIMTGVWMNFACDILSIYFPSNIVTI